MVSIVPYRQGGAAPLSKVGYIPRTLNPHFTGFRAWAF